MTQMQTPIDLVFLDETKRAISNYVLIHRGLRHSELVLKLDIPTEVLERAIHELVQENELVRIEYTIPGLNSRFFQFYLPQGSKTY